MGAVKIFIKYAKIKYLILSLLIILILVVILSCNSSSDQEVVFGDSYTQQQKQEMIDKLPAEYKRLGEECKKRESFSCCMSSVKYMASVNATPIKSETLKDSKCPVGYGPNMLRCPDSYRWCEPSVAK